MSEEQWTDEEFQGQLRLQNAMDADLMRGFGQKPPGLSLTKLNANRRRLGLEPISQEEWDQ